MYYNTKLPDGNPYADVMFPIQCLFFDPRNSNAVEDIMQLLDELTDLTRKIRRKVEELSDDYI